MSEAKNEFKEAPLPFKAIFTYNLPTVGIGFMFFIVALYLMKFSTDVLLISPAIMGLIFGISRIWDAVTDPLAGYFSDRTTLKSGRRKSWIFASIIPVCASFYMMWNPPTSLSNWETTLWMGAAVL
jgi:oligogalacturonide transporter